jgi:hypothetical protein
MDRVVDKRKIRKSTRELLAAQKKMVAKTSKNKKVSS